MFAFVRLLGYDFLNASVSAKLLNLPPMSRPSFCLREGPYLVAFHGAAGRGQRTRQHVGTYMALRHGTGFVRAIFILVVGALM